MISAVRADDLIPVGVAAFETAIRNAGRLTAQDRLAAVAGPTGERGCRDGLELNAQPRVTAITRGRCGDGGRTSISHDVIRVASTAHSTHRQEALPGRYRGLEQRRRLSPDGSTQAVRGHVPPSRRTPDNREMWVSFPEPAVGGVRDSGNPLSSPSVTERAAAGKAAWLMYTRRQAEPGLACHLDYWELAAANAEMPVRLERAASLASKEARPERIQAGLFPAPLGGVGATGR